ncbi:MAG: 16S rRNA (uracil(1498)-N(3))-methyltransferase [Planctomycetota bacterium]
MNLILLHPSDFIAPATVRLAGRRLDHVREILKPAVNDALTVGLEGGHTGTGRVTAIDDRVLVMEVVLTESPPPKLPVILCLALMRPIVLKRAIQTAVSMGVEEIILLHSRRVEKSFWQSTVLGDGELRELAILGLEQAKDTVVPGISFQKRFKPFVEDVLPVLIKGRAGVAADPGGELLTGRDMAGPLVLVIGPEGGFIPYEIEKLKQAGCRVVSLGPRVLKVETAIVALLAKLFL